MANGMFHPDFASFEDLNEKKKSEEVYVAPFVEITELDLNLEVELLAQYNKARKLLHAAEVDASTPLNQKAQVINSATSILAALTKSQAELYSLERIRRIEHILIKTLKLYPELQEAFMADYAEAFGNDT